MNLDVLIPSLLLPAPLQQLIPPPEVPVLQRLLARADQADSFISSGSSWLFSLWGVVSPYPFAAMLADYDGLSPTGDAWLFAEPVHMLPERGRMKLFPGRFLELTIEESGKLVASLNAHFADRNLTFEAPSANRWYVRCAPAEIPDTSAPDQARFGDLADFHPKSSGSLDWRALQNEAQMLFHTHEVNVAREAAGKPTISGIWVWGGGTVPALTQSRYQRVIADLPLAVQLARRAGTDVAPLSWPAVESSSGDVLLVLEELATCTANADLLAWQRELARIERDWFTPISIALANGRIQRLSIHVPNGERTRSFHITRFNYWCRFWRSTGSLARYA